MAGVLGQLISSLDENEKGDKMMKSGIVMALIGVLFLVTGCDYFNKSKFHGKTFKVRAELKEGKDVEVVTWTNANKLEYDKEDYVYSFYVNGKLVVIEPGGTVIIEEQ